MSDTGYTTDRSNPDLHQDRGDGQYKTYLVLSDEERARGFVRPLRKSYIHTVCHSKTSMGLPLCETYARNPKFYGRTFCTQCHDHFPVSEFTWVEDGQVVGS